MRAQCVLPAVAMAALYLFFVCTNLLWLRINRGVGWDDTVLHPMHVLDILDYGRVQEDGAQAYPPLGLHLMSAGNWLLGDRSVAASLSFSMPVLLLIFFSGMFGMGVLLGDAWIGVGASFFSMTVPAWFHLSRVPLLDFPVAVLLLFCVFLLMKSGSFRSLRYSSLLGLCAGLGMLTKQTFPLYFWLPASFAMVHGLRRHRREATRNILAFLLLYTAVWAPVYVSHKGLAALYAANLPFGRGAPEIAGLPPVFSVPSLAYYLRRCLDSVFNGCLVSLFLASVAYLFWAGGLDAAMALPLCAVAGTLLSFCLVHWKDARYIVPFVPFVLLTVTAAAWRLPGRLLRAVVLAALAVLGLHQFALVGFGIRLFPSLSPALDLVAIESGPNLWEAYTPDEGGDAELATLLDVGKDRRRDPAIGVCSGPAANSETALLSALAYSARLHRLPLRRFVVMRSPEDLSRAGFGFDYVVTYRDRIADPRYEFVSSHPIAWYGKAMSPINLYKRTSPR